MASAKRSNGEGSVYFDTARGMYVGSRVIGWRDGKPIRRKVSAKSKQAASAKLEKMKAQIDQGHLPGGRVPTVAEWMTHWLENIAANKNRPSTLAAYGTYVNRYINPLLGHRRLDKLTPEHISEAWASLAANGCPGKVGAKPLSSTTLHQAHVILARALKVAMQRGHLTRNVATLIDAPQALGKPVDILSLEQGGRVMAAAKGKRNGARFTVAFAIGLRQGEALGLRWSDVDLDARTIVVRHSLGRVKGQGLTLGPTKSGKPRAIALPAKLVAELRTHRAAQTAERLAAGSWWVDGDYVFTREDGRPIDPKDDWTLWRALLAEAEVPIVRLHAARHTAATMCLALGVPEKIVMEMFGHSRAEITRGYQKRVDALHLDAADKIDSTPLWG